MSGGVRNLRAMFENKDTADLPDRGRSPAGSASIGVPSTGTSPRPLSKVRTSFVTVERPGETGGQLGLKKEGSGEPGMPDRRSSFTIDPQNAKDAIEKRAPMATDSGFGKPSSSAETAVLDSAKGTPRVEGVKKVESSGGIERRKETVKPVTAKPDGKATATHANGTGKSTAVKPAEKLAPTKTSTRPPPISVAKASTAPKASPKNAKPPVVPRTPTTPNRSRAKEAPAKVAEKKPIRTSAAASNTSKPISRQPTAAAHSSAPKTRIQASPPQTGFRKPKPRSPTRPIKLPASLTAHTASSGSKTTSSPPSARRSLSRASGNSQPANSLQAHHALSRSPSRASTTTSKSTLARKPSNLNKSTGRPSLGPPPASLKKKPSRPSLTQQSSTPDDSFLARMMRPTTSSASKTADKPDTTPPKRAESVKTPATRDGTLRAHDSSKGSPTPKARVAAPVKVAAKQVKPAAKETKAATPKAINDKLEAKPKAAAAEEPAPVEEAVAKDVKEAPIENTTANSPPTKVVEVPTAVIDVKAEPEITASEEVEVAEDPVIPEAVSEAIEDDQSVTIPQPEEVSIAGPVALPPAVNEEVVVEKEDEAAPEQHTVDQQHEEAFVQPAVEQEEPIPSPVEPEPVKEEPPHVTEEASKDAPAQPEVIPPPADSKHETVEDPEDAKAREEIARLNVEFSKVAAAEEAEQNQVD